jgi:1,2-diacylglycerol 3-alpha-glucosyltransferase
MRRQTVVIMVDEVPPWLRANFNAAGKLLDLVTVEAARGRNVDREGFTLDCPEHFVRRAVISDIARNGAGIRQFGRQVAQVLSDIKPEAVVTLGWSDAKNLAALRWCVANRVASIVATDTTEHDFRRRWWREALKRKVIRLYSAGWAAGSLSARYLVHLGMAPERIVVGPVDTIDVSHFEKGAAAARRNPNLSRRDLGVPDEYFLAVSRFAPEKNLLNLIKAYRAYRERVGTIAWKLVLVGDGPTMRAVRHDISDSRLDGWVHLPGWVTFEKLPAYYGLANAFVHASTRDTWGVVVNEAMAAGLTVIVSRRCGSASELVRDGCNGFTFDPTDVAELAELLYQVAHGKCDRAALGRTSLDTIQGWTPITYAKSLVEAVHVAMGKSLPSLGLLDRVLLSRLMYLHSRV